MEGGGEDQPRNGRKKARGRRSCRRKEAKQGERQHATYVEVAHRIQHLQLRLAGPRLAAVLQAAAEQHEGNGAELVEAVRAALSAEEADVEVDACEALVAMLAHDGLEAYVARVLAALGLREGSARKNGGAEGRRECGEFAGRGASNRSIAHPYRKVRRPQIIFVDRHGVLADGRGGGGCRHGVARWREELICELSIEASSTNSSFSESSFPFRGESHEEAAGRGVNH